MTLSTLWHALNKFDFDTCNYKEAYTFSYKYDIRSENDVDLLDMDSADAVSCVEKLNLSYDINARHYSTVVNGDRITDMVEVTWKFWRE